MSTAVDPGRPMTHLGLLYDRPDDLVEVAAPYVERALERGEAVSTLVDRRTARGLRDALGDRGDALTSLSPHTGSPHAEDTLRRLRATLAATARRTLVLTQYSALALPPDEIALCEAGVNVVFGDRPFTMLCACDRDSPQPLLDALRQGHPELLDGPDATDNPSFLTPEDRCSTASAVWDGVHVLRLHFGATDDLQRIRTHVAALAAEVGLRGESAQAAVLAVHEAAVVACDEVADARAVGVPTPPRAAPPAADAPAAVRGRPGPGDPCVLDVWTAGPRMVAEVHGPRAAAGPEGARLPRNRLRMAGPLRLVRSFCQDVTTRETPTARTVRIVVPR